MSFYTATDNVAYTVKIFDSFIDGQLQNELSVISGNISHTGFHTIDLAPAVALTEGNDFYIYLNLSAGGQPFDRTSDVPVLLGATSRTIVESSAHPGESYYRNGSHWDDLYVYDNTANFCIKGLVFGPTPQLNITLRGGIGLGTTCTIKNVGTANATNVSWAITTTGGLLNRIHNQKTGTIESMAIGNENTVKSNVIFGLGTIMIVVTVESNEGAYNQKIIQGVQLLFFTKE